MQYKHIEPTNIQTVKEFVIPIIQRDSYFISNREYIAICLFMLLVSLHKHIK